MLSLLLYLLRGLLDISLVILILLLVGLRQIWIVILTLIIYVCRLRIVRFSIVVVMFLYRDMNGECACYFIKYLILYFSWTLMVVRVCWIRLQSLFLDSRGAIEIAYVLRAWIHRGWLRILVLSLGFQLRILHYIIN